MKRVSRLLVGVDFSEPARAAFETALALSASSGAEMTIVHAVPADQPFRWRAKERMRLMRELRQAMDRAGVRFVMRVQHGEPAGVILLHARAKPPDLLVVGTHQRSGFDRVREGSVAERVIRGAPCRVLVVPPPAPGVRRPAASFRNILAAVDVGAASDRVRDEALSLGRESGGRVTLVHVVPGPASGRVPRHLYRFGGFEHQTLLMADARRALQDTVLRATLPLDDVRTHVVAGDPPAAIEKVASQIGADLIVTGVKPRGMLSLGGSMAARIIRTAGRPVLLVPQGARLEVPGLEVDQHRRAA